MMTHTLLTVLILATAASNAAKIKKPKETAENYETVTPVVTYEDNTLPYPLEMSIEIPTANVTYTLILTLNEMVMSRHFKSVIVGKKGNKVDKTRYLNCYYQGEVEGHPDWTASMSTCHGLQGTFGNHEVDGSFYNLRPLDKKNTAINQLHALYLNDDTKDGGSCGSGEEHRHMLPPAITKGNRTRRQSSGTRFVEFVLVNDIAQFRSQNNDLQNTVERAINIANGVDNIFRQLNIRVILTETITFTSSNPFPVSSNPSMALNSFTDYVRSDILATTQYDSIMLITGIDLDGSTVGIAFIGTMCTRSSSTGLTQDGLGRSLSSVTSTAAHELGHVFNMNHDDGRGCTCAANQCVMSAVSGFPPPTFWSSCSVSDLNVLYSRGGDSCLFNTPTTIVGDPVCGNGILEENEECDCGSPAECTNPCCDAATCLPVTGAECASGACCTSQCSLALYGTECRASSGDCDIAEFCLGDFNECPGDDIVANGVSCASDEGYCSEGSCPTLDNQCADSFGSAAGVSQCFNQNTRGDQFGYCEQPDAGVFTSCASSDVMCGQLRCQDGVYTGSLGRGGTVTTFTLVQGVCRAFVSNDPTNLNAGLVTDGTRCGEGWVCERSRCVEQRDLTSCPVGANNAECSGSSNGICNNRGVCSCNVGFTGSACEAPITEQDVDECLLDNGGCSQVCTNTPDSFQCSCTAGFSLGGDGRTCFDINECLSNNGGCSQFCTNTIGSFVCSCQSGFISNGATCIDINECAVNNGGCQQFCSNTNGGFICSCASGFTSSGAACTDIDECNVNNGGCSQFCTNSIGSFVCNCQSGFISSGATCIDINECAVDNGGCQQICSNSNGGFECSCQSGFTSSGAACTDINECDVDNGGCDTICMNTAGSFQCSCDGGFEFNADGSCVDINECQSGSDNCQQICSNTEGSFECSCQSGFTSSGAICTDINECAVDNGGCQQICSNTGGSFECSCQSGFTSSGAACTDINECDVDNGGCDTICMNTAGSFQCSCDGGFEFDADGNCVDINECQSSSDNCQQICSNTEGSFECSCLSGFTSSGAICTDINECAVDDGGCSQICSNTDGSFVCSCQSGFVSLGATCIDINECAVDNGGCQQICSNSNGAFECSCQSGFTSSGATCTDINECDVDNGGCDTICMNTAGSFQCSCDGGFNFDADGSCVDINECQFDVNNCQQICSNTEGSFTCSCQTGFISSGATCTDIDECEISNGGCQQICTNSEGSFECSCQPGFTSSGAACIDIDECATSNRGCEQNCTNNEGSFECSCGPGFMLGVDGMTCSNGASLDTSYTYTGDTPSVQDNSVRLQLAFGSGVEKATCLLALNFRVVAKADCSSGSAEFNFRGFFSAALTPVVEILGRDEEDPEKLVIDRERNFRLSGGFKCSSHLINRGVTQSRNADNSVQAVIEWGLSRPSAVEASEATFICSLDGSPTFQCESPYETGVLSAGPHSLRVRPLTVPGCRYIMTKAFNFQVL